MCILKDDVNMKDRDWLKLMNFSKERLNKSITQETKDFWRTTLILCETYYKKENAI